MFMQTISMHAGHVGTVGDSSHEHIRMPFGVKHLTHRPPAQHVARAAEAHLGKELLAERRVLCIRAGVHQHLQTGRR